MQSRLTRLIGVVFPNGAMLSLSYKSNSVTDCTQEISELIKLHIQGAWAWQNAHKFIGELPKLCEKISILMQANVLIADWYVAPLFPHI